MLRPSLRAALPALALALCAACGETTDSRERDAIQEALRAYQPKLAEAYATGNVEAVRGFATAAEMDNLERKVMDRAADGKVLEVHPKSLEVEALNTNNGTPVVLTLETWDLELYAAGSHQLIKQGREQRYRVRYRLQREGTGWRVDRREVEKVFE